MNHIYTRSRPPDSTHSQGSYDPQILEVRVGEKFFFFFLKAKSEIIMKAHNVNIIITNVTLSH